MKKLGFGLMRLPLNSGNQKDINIDELCKMTDMFLDRGFTYFDTSYVYHEGASETAIREALVSRHDRESFQLASKFPTFLMPNEEDVDRIFNEQLEKCGVTFFDYYLLHNLNRYLYRTEVHDARLFEHMKKWKADGKIKHIAFSWHDSADELNKVLNEHPEVEAVQIALNYYDWDEPFIQAGACYETIVKHGARVIAMEPVKGGTLSNVPASVAERMKELDPEASPASYAIRFAASLPGVMIVLSGMSSMPQVEDNTGFMQELKPLSDAEKDMLNFAKSEYTKNWKYNCKDFSILDNNKSDVPISGIIRAYNSLLLQPDPYFGAELNYYKSFRSAYDISFENDNYSDMTKAIGGAFDVNKALKEAIDFQTKNSFQTYM